MFFTSLSPASCCSTAAGIHTSDNNVKASYRTSCTHECTYSYQNSWKCWTSEPVNANKQVIINKENKTGGWWVLKKEWGKKTHTHTHYTVKPKACAGYSPAWRSEWDLWQGLRLGSICETLSSSPQMCRSTLAGRDSTRKHTEANEGDAH